MKIEGGYSILDNQWITLSDGVRLSAKIWLPDISFDTPVPAVLELLPYSLRYYTHLRDDTNYPIFAAAGIAGIRVDIRGFGESEGLSDGEYTQQQIDDACEIIVWISQQKWCNGSVGMMGICWSGHSSMQVALANPPALKAIISVCATTDRYNDYIHFKNGCFMHPNLYWSAAMLGYQGRAPDPRVVGNNWRQMRQDRLENAENFLDDYFEHPCRDNYWQLSNIDLSAIKIPVLVVGGWADGNRNGGLCSAATLNDKSKIVIGPWIHKYPHMAYPKPRWEFRHEAIQWWKKWLSGQENGIENLPRLRAYILDSPSPSVERTFDHGNWVAKNNWTTPQMETFYTGCSSCGEFFTLKVDAEMPGDQQFDDAICTIFETQPLESPREYLGFPIFEADVSCADETAHLIIRLVDVHPDDGKATRVSLGMLNLSYREHDTPPKSMPKNRKEHIRIELDSCGYCFQQGHKIRLSLSTTYWPMVFPSASTSGIQIYQNSIKIHLPVLESYEKIDLPEPCLQISKNENFLVEKNKSKIEPTSIDLAYFYVDVPEKQSIGLILSENQNFPTRQNHKRISVDVYDGVLGKENLKNSSLLKRASITDKLRENGFRNGFNLLDINRWANRFVKEKMREQTLELIRKDVQEAKKREKQGIIVERYIKDNLMTRRIHYHVFEDYGLKKVASTNGLYIHCTREEKWSAIPDEPLSCKGESTIYVKMLRADEKFGLFHTSTIGKTELAATAENWIVKGNLQAFEGDEKIFDRKFDKVFKRFLM